MNWFKKLNDWVENLTMRVSIQDQVLFARHLAVMARAGLPLLESLKMIQKETRSRAMLKILNQLIVDVSNGQFLSASLDKFKRIFGNLFVNIVRVGESTGILSENLNYLADELKKKQELRKKVVGALIYPAVIFIATFGITGLLVVFIFPKILPIFKSLNVELPATTKFLIFLSNLFTNYGPIMFGVLVILFIALRLILRIRKIRYYYNYALLYMPVFGKIFRGVNLANLVRTLGLTLKSGIKVVEAITITADSLSNLVYQDALKELAEEVKRGEAIAPYLGRFPRLFPLVMSQMIAVGESSGNLSETLLYLSEFYESEVNDLTKNLSTILEPMLMVMMGVIVGFIAISIITPIYEVTSSIGRR